MPLFGDAIADCPLEFSGQRQHGAKNFADRGEVVVRDPLAKTNQLLIEHGCGVEHADEVFRGHIWLAVMQLL